MSFNAGSITTSLSFELSPKGKQALKAYESALASAKKDGHITAKLDAKVDDRGFKSYEKTSDRVHKTNKKSESSFRSTGKAAAGYGAAFLGGAGLLSITKKSIDLASDQGESLSKNKTLFGDSSKAASDFAATSAKSFGISQSAALEATGVFGNLQRSLGIGKEAAVKSSVALTQLGADLASFNNTSVDDAMLALRSGLLGEAEPLRKFGVSLSDVAIKAEAARMGIVKVDKAGGEYQLSLLKLKKAEEDQASALKKSGKGSDEYRKATADLDIAQRKMYEVAAGSKQELTAKQKAEAAQSLIFRQTKLAQGDFKRTNQGLANQKKILTAQMDDLQMKLGKSLIPVLLQLIKVITAFSKVPAGVKIAIGAFVGFAAAAVVVAKVVTALKTLNEAFKIMTGVSKVMMGLKNLATGFRVALVAVRAFAMSSMLAMGPIGLAIIALVAIVALIIWKWKDVRKALGAIFNWLKGAAKDAFGFIKKLAHMGLLGPALLIITRWGEVKAFLGKTWNWMKNAASNAFNFLKKVITTYIGFYTSMPGKIGRALSGIFGKISSPFIKAFNAIKKAAADAFNWVKDKAANSLPGKAIGAVKGFLGLSEGGKVGPGAGGPKMYVAGEGGKAEWVVSQEGNRKKNIGFALDALQSLGVPMFAKGGIASGKKSITNLQRLESLKEQDIARMGAEAGIDGVTTPAESQGILNQKAKLSTLYRTEQDAVLRVLALINSERSAVKQDMRGTKGNKRQKLAEKLANLDGDKSTYAGRKDELRGILGQAAAEIATGNNELLALAAVDTSADGSIQAARDAILLDEVTGRDTAGDKKTLAGAIRKRVDELTARFRTASGPSRAAIGDALSSSFSEWKGLQDDTSASSSSLGFSQQVNNLTSARTSMYQSAGNAVGGTTVNLAVNGLQTTSDPHLFARRVQAELALI